MRLSIVMPEKMNLWDFVYNLRQKIILRVGGQEGAIRGAKEKDWS